MKKQKVGVFFSSGLGNALLLVPLLKNIPKETEVYGIFNSPYNCEELFWDNSLVHKKITIHKFSDYFKLIPLFKSFSIIYLDFFAVNKKNVLISWYISKNIYAHASKIKIPSFININWVYITTKQHMALTNLKLLNKSLTLNLQDFYLPTFLNFNQKHFIEAPYIVVQLSSGNNTAPYKTWDIYNWKQLIEKIIQNNPQLHIVLLGDIHEVNLWDHTEESKQIINLLGKTTISEVMQIIQHALLFIGHDSGLMHISVGMGTKTCTIWGGSDYEIYGYESFDNKLHRIIAYKESCWPCNSWYKPNISKTSNPLNCPDFSCLKHITVNQVYQQVKEIMHV